MAVVCWTTAIEQMEQAVTAVVLPSSTGGEAFATDLFETLRDLDEADLTDIVRRLHRAASRLSAAAAAASAEWDQRRVWRAEGHRAAGTALSTIAAVSPVTARRDLKRGRAMRDMPRVTAAVLEGRLTVDHLDLLARAHSPWRRAMFAEHEQLLVDHCRQFRFVEARRLVDYWVQRVDDTATAAEARLRSDSLHCWASTTLDGRVVVDAVLDPIGGEIVSDELHRLARGEYLKDLRSGSARTPAQLRAAALVEMARRSASLVHGAPRARPMFVVHVGEDSLRHLCQLASGVVLHPSELVPYVDEAMMETILFDTPHTVVGVSAQRSFTGVLRRAIMARDKFCTHPSGCDEPAHRCDVDHVIPWSRGGPTRQENGRLRCSTHNRDPHLWPADMFTSGAPPGPARHGPGRGPQDTPATELPPAYRHITADDIASVRRRWRTRHGLSAPEGGRSDAA